MRTFRQLTRCMCENAGSLVNRQDQIDSARFDRAPRQRRLPRTIRFPSDRETTSCLDLMHTSDSLTPLTRQDVAHRMRTVFLHERMEKVIQRLPAPIRSVLYRGPPATPRATDPDRGPRL